MSVVSALKPSLLRLFIAHDAVGARKVSSLVTGSKSKLGVIVLVAAVSVDSPFVRALEHNKEPRTFPVCVVESAETPQERIARRRKPGSGKTSPTVEKALMLK